jgi:electron transfer flavoprotein alpha subunit
MKTAEENKPTRGVWVFGDYRNYFQNRVTLQLIAKGKELAGKLGTDLTVLVLGHQVHQYAMEYVAHGADVIMAVDDPLLKTYQVETYSRVVADLVKAFEAARISCGGDRFRKRVLSPPCQTSPDRLECGLPFTGCG